MPDINNDLIYALWGIIDGWVGTDGKTSNLYTAVNTYNWRRIILAEGATISQAVTLSGNGGFIWSPYTALALDIGSAQIVVTGNSWHLAGFQINGCSSPGILISGTAAYTQLERVSCVNGSSHGLHINTSGNDHSIHNCFFNVNATDGIKIQSGASGVRVVNSMCYGNGGYGVNDSSGTSMGSCCRLDGNTLGATNGITASQWAANKES
jgi:hypothetical protein